MSTRGVPPTGWHVEILHPDTGRKRVPDVVDLQNAPVFNPGPNAQPIARIPVRKDTVWLSEAYDADPEMRVWRDGRQLPIEVLRNVEQREGATILVGVGGVELEGRVTEEYNDDRRHLAVRDLVETETTYGVDAPEPETETLADVVQQSADTSAEFTATSSFLPTDPFVIENGIVRGAQVNHVREGEDRDRGGASTGSDGSASNGQFIAFGDSDDTAEFDITPEYEHPADELDIWLRVLAVNETSEVDVSLNVNGTSYLINTITAGVEITSDIWFQMIGGTAFAGGGYAGPNIGPDDDVTIELEGVFNTIGTTQVDVVALTDERFDVTFPGTLTNGYFDGPATHVAVDATFDNAPSAFNVTAGSADVTINDTTGNQRLQISNDNGSTWLPDDGTENNTASVSVDYPSAGSGSRLRVTLDAYEPNGPRDQTPRLNYASQALDAYTLRADITQELLLIAETFDNSLASVLTSIGEPAERSWGLQTDANGDIVVRFVQNGQFTADFTPEFSDRAREKLGKTYQRVTVKGSNEPESNVPYTASTSYTALPRNNILTGSETVYDDTRNYDRGDDYEVRYRDGEIRATEGGDLTPGTDYRIDFRYQAQGTFTSPDAPADPNELVETVPGVTSERLAEQVAFVIASEADTPRYAAEVTIPDPDPRFDPTDALPPGALGLPSGIESLEVRGEPQLTEEGLAVRFGTRPPVEATQQRISRQLGRVSDRS
jgi:hypothetical protein